MEPNVLLRPFGSGPSVALYGAPANWSVNVFQETGDYKRNPELYHRYNHISERHRLLDMFLPAPTDFNTQICDRRGFNVSIHNGVGSVRLWKGARVDGVIMPNIRHLGCGMPTADCPTILAYCQTKNTSIVAHAGLRSIIDVDRIFSGVVSPRHFSVVDSIAESFGEHLSKVKVFITCGISGDSYRYPELTQFVTERFGSDCVLGESIDLKKVITRQFQAHGVTHILTDTINTFSDRTPSGEFMWHSYRRDRTPKRNLILVTS